MKKLLIAVIFLVFVDLLFFILIISQFNYTKNFQKNLDEIIKNYLSQMPLEEKVGQMFIWGIDEPALSTKSASMLKETHAGGVIILANRTTPEVIKLTQDIKKLNNKLPLFIAFDGEIGSSNIQDNVFCTRVREKSQSLYDEGINLNFGAIADIGWVDGFIKNRTYGDTPEEVKNKIKLAITCSEKVLTTAKHFPGHGRTKENSHETIPIIDIDYNIWKKTDALPFQEAINNNVDFIMVGHLKYEKIDSQPASLSLTHHNIIRKMGFDGIIITDDMGMLDSHCPDRKSLLDQAISANNDIILYDNSNLNQQELYQHVLEQVRNNQISQKRIDESVKRIIRVKYLNNQFLFPIVN